MNKEMVLLTGASSGIGKEVASQLVKEKRYFPLLVARNIDKLQELKNEIKDCDIYSCDVTNPEQVKNLVDQVVSKYGGIDVLINNAGYGRFGGALDIPISDYIGMMETNYLGAVRLTHAFLPYMLKAGSGKIINIASVAGLSGSPNLAAYCASKFALVGFSEALRLEYAPRIQVGVLCPGPVQTPFFRGDDPSDLFPTPIARQILDVQTVAHHAVQLINRPRVKVIPRGLRWSMQFRKLVPGFYLQITKKLYDSLKIRTKARRIDV
ncbi:SDR family NAD(P)-dependent oxidoreductase [Risungbinella massiliensis]|uniref:SDR family NAD(P)-dependent oxidoreductase n=1 Tax=Risungbinella massiliensis TaxID=1329796 RepID=UPI00164EB630|nr:SDR family oxidoreductase [Risungbinella massiliensis]